MKKYQLELQGCIEDDNIECDGSCDSCDCELDDTGDTDEYSDYEDPNYEDDINTSGFEFF